MTGRFINADDTSILQMTQGELLGGNLYAYCGNCPVMMTDGNGTCPFINGFIDHFKSYYYLFKVIINDPIGFYINYMTNPWNWFPAAQLMKMQISDVVNIWKALLTGNISRLGYIFGDRVAIAVEMLVFHFSIKLIGKVVASINSGGRIKYTDHGYKQAMGRDGGRGISDSAIRDTIKNPTKISPQSGGRLRFEGSQGVVVLNKFGEIITCWAKSSKYWRKG